MAFTDSSLATVTIISPYHTTGRDGSSIDTITIHCSAGSKNSTAASILNWLAQPKEEDMQASCNYAVGGDGSIGLGVHESDRSWCSSSSSNDKRAVTIEVASDATEPCNITSTAYETLIKLVADICSRNNITELKWKADKSLIGQVDQQNMTVHRWFSSKSCPGEYLYTHHTDIANRVNELLDSGYVNPGVPITDSGNNSYVPTTPGGSTVSGSLGSTTTVGSSGYTPHDVDGQTALDIKNSLTNHKPENVLELNKKISKVNTQVMNNHDVTAFIAFSVNNFQLDTRDEDSFNHYAISLKNEKTGVGQGNKFTLKIAYHKDFSNYADINKLEQALTSVRTGSLFASTNGGDVMYNTRNDLNTKNVCKLQYGYICNDPTLVSPEYSGLLLSYSVRANKQIVEYTLQGYTGEQVILNTVNWYPNIVGMDKVQTNNGTVLRANIAPKTQTGGNSMSQDEIEQLINDLNNEYAGGITYNPYFALSDFLDDYNNAIGAETGSTKKMKYELLDCTNGNKGYLGEVNTLAPVRMSICKGQTVLKYAEYCISLFKYQKTDNYAIQYLKQQQQTTERFIYTLVRDKNNPYLTYICIDYIDSSDIQESQVAYKFYGYATDNALVIDYNIDYDGTVALAVADNYSEDEEDTTAIYIGSDGALRSKVSITRDMFVAGEIDDVLIAKQNTWLDKISVANGASLKVFGLPFEISVGTIFRCGLYISDTLHHTSGNCFVTSVTDNIENSVFTTDIEMIRLPGKNKDIE